MFKKFWLVLLIICITPTIIFAEKTQLENNISADINFSPKGEIEQSIVNLINNTKSSLYISTYQFTNNKICNAIYAALNRGVKVSMIIDEGLLSSKSSVFIGSVRYTVPQLLSKLYSMGVIIYVDDKVAIHHNKFIISDLKIIGTGSFNFSENAQKNNRENYIIFNSVNVSMIYYKQFLKIIPACQKFTGL
jgi:phosphatidylserine/phosphatidylglycerophosphate/cardiolipin synthase-like enzyme